MVKTTMITIVIKNAARAETLFEEPSRLRLDPIS